MIKKTIPTLLFSIVLLGNASAQEYAEGEFTLPSLIAKSINYHPSVKSSLFLENSAKEDVDTAEWQYFPTPKFSVSQVNSSTTDFNYNGDKRVMILGLTQPLWAGGSIDAGLEKSKAQLLSTRATTKVTQQELALRVIGAYSKWYDSYLTKATYQKSQKEHEVLRVRLRRRVEEGLSSNNDLNLVDSRLGQANAGLNSATIQHESSLLRLEELIGTPLNPQDLIRDFSIVKFKSEPSEISKRALLINPRIKQIKAESIVIGAEIKQSKAALYPTVNLRVEKQYGNFTTKDAKNEKRVFLEFNSSFGAGLSNFSNIRQAENRHRSVQEKIDTEEKQTAQQVQLDWMSSASLEKQKELFESALFHTEKVQKSYYRQFLVGRKTWQEVMNAIREVSDLESKLAKVYAEMTVTNWRMFIYVEDINTIVNSITDKNVVFSHIEKVFWRPDDKPKEVKSVINKAPETDAAQTATTSPSATIKTPPVQVLELAPLTEEQVQAPISNPTLPTKKAKSVINETPATDITPAPVAPIPASTIKKSEPAQTPKPVPLVEKQVPAISSTLPVKKPQLPFDVDPVTILKPVTEAAKNPIKATRISIKPQQKRKVVWGTKKAHLVQFPSR